MKNIILLFIALFLATSCGKKEDTYLLVLQDAELFHRSMKRLTDVIVHDIFSPPVASRVYAYPSIAAYEVLAINSNELTSFGGQLNGLETFPEVATDDVNLNLAAVHAFLNLGQRLIFSEDRIVEYREQLYNNLREQGLSSSTEEASIAYGDAVADHIASWMDVDLYHQTRTFPQYTIRDETQYWKPTPPDYMNGIEPHWNKIRTMVLDSANQFKPIDPHPFSLEENSVFYAQLKEVYDIGKNLSEEETAIAKFWDCNPYVSHHYGHAMFATKKITPGGHWIGIAAIASRQSQADFGRAVETYAMTSIALFDAFISCWDEKWRSIVVRPETLINQYLDEDWVPLLQTPPFPEYTSGHSVISRAAAVTLTNLYGENFAFHDTTELEYGLPARQFTSFISASEEAAISRLYGGIHYMMACENGVTQGQEVGEFIVRNLKSRGGAVAENQNQ